MYTAETDTRARTTRPFKILLRRLTNHTLIIRFWGKSSKITHYFDPTRFFTAAIKSPGSNTSLLFSDAESFCIA